MSMFNWFGKHKEPPPQTAAHTSSGLGQLDATVPNVPSARTPPASVAAGSRRQERHAMRELLYTVVRESMHKMGALSSDYTFKVLSLDARGRQYLVMMDLRRPQSVDISRSGETETLIAQTAKARHDILVTAVYWRISEQPVSRPAAPAAVPAAVAATPARSPFEPIQQAEVDAFKQALAQAPRRPVSPPIPATFDPTEPEPDHGFAETEIDERAAPLSATQYGGL